MSTSSSEARKAASRQKSLGAAVSEHLTVLTSFARSTTSPSARSFVTPSLPTARFAGRSLTSAKRSRS